ncbi:MAG: glutamate-5-semialdehyde dehydrogenase [Bifidobacteriaceae bacterium]|nr:glutamate-5-semialdehyde dehydrogenase [Bifidobacteriaceae bacterium]
MADADISLDAALEHVAGMARTAKRYQSDLARATSSEKDELLRDIATALVDHADTIAAENKKDMASAAAEGMDEGLLDRLSFTPDRIASTAKGVLTVAELPDPVGEVVRGRNMPNGMRLTQARVPMGIVGMIYEARPNVTVDVAALTLKSGNAVILRGGHAADRTNAATISVIGEVLSAHGFDPSLVQTVDPLGRIGATAMMQARGSIDVLVPRGGAGLIKSVVENSKVPVIETGSGNVHIYVDASADLDKAIPIILNSKTQRVGVCNAAEKLLVHRSVAAQFLPRVLDALEKKGVVIKADQPTLDVAGGVSIPGLKISLADDSDWGTEYLALKMGIKIVDSLDEAINHINKFSTGHTEAILSQDYAAIEEFTSRIDSAVVMVNASTRFTDGGMFGLGAELGISTQKLHARGPMGLEELTTTKWVAYGNGQVRP